MAGNYEVIKVRILPMYDASGSSYPIGAIIVKTIKIN
jgi:hypothetical protein